MSLFRKSIILIGDILALYASLAITLLIRYKISEFDGVFRDHLAPFSIIFLIWISIFYISDLYKNEYLGVKYPTIQKFIFAISINIVAAITLFYLFPSSFLLTPKTNLFLIALIFCFFDLGWRFAASKIYISGGLKNRILIIGDSPAIGEISNFIKTNPQIGYEIASHAENFSEIKNLPDFCAKEKIDLVVIKSSLKKDPTISKSIYKLLTSKIPTVDSATFYEFLFQKISFEELDETWFIEKIIPRRPIYEKAKRLLDFALSLILIIILSPLMILIAILIKLTSKGPIIYKQERVGFGEKNFMLFKFRSMIANHSGPHATMKNDDRITPLGKIIRFSHLDEFPQLFNIFKGDISFIGPRAEASKLVETYKQLSYYDLRHTIKPGLTGWAQVNYKPSATLKEANEKLKYDIYYIKNRSLALDFLIFLKTIKYFFTSSNIVS